ncbi:MAG: DinB family protein [Vicinamibacterales bacterium]
MQVSIPRPAPDEYSEFHAGYLAATGDATDALAVFDGQAAALAALARVPDADAAFRYAPEKWSVRQVTGHLADGERILACRLLRTARADTTSLPGYDENLYVDSGRFDRRTQADVGAELLAVRAATLALVRSLEPDVLMRRTVVNGWSLTVRALAFIAAGHVEHHLRLLRDRYRLALP